VTGFRLHRHHKLPPPPPSEALSSRPRASRDRCCHGHFSGYRRHHTGAYPPLGLVSFSPC
jgi:hypothetical protein